MNNNIKESKAMSADKQIRPTQPGQSIPLHPDYPDEISEEQLVAIRKLADPDGSNAEQRVLVYPEAW